MFMVLLVGMSVCKSHYLTGNRRICMIFLPEVCLWPIGTINHILRIIWITIQIEITICIAQICMENLPRINPSNLREG